MGGGGGGGKGGGGKGGNIGGIIGAVVGSIIPGVGTVIGATVGTVAGDVVGSVAAGEDINMGRALVSGVGAAAGSFIAGPTASAYGGVVPKAVFGATVGALSGSALARTGYEYINPTQQAQIENQQAQLGTRATTGNVQTAAQELKTKRVSRIMNLTSQSRSLVSDEATTAAVGEIYSKLNSSTSGTIIDSIPVGVKEDMAMTEATANINKKINDLYDSGV